MFVPAKRKYMSEHLCETVKVGETWDINSGLGGSFTVEFMGGEAWKIISKGWERTLEIKKEIWTQTFFILVPTLPF